MSINNDPRPGRPTTSTDERSVKLVADALVEDLRATYEKLSRPWEQKPRRKMHKNRHEFLVVGPLILHDNARPHIADVVTRKLRDYGWNVLPYVPYSPDMSPPDFDLFPNVESQSLRSRETILKDCEQINAKK